MSIGDQVVNLAGYSPFEAAEDLFVRLSGSSLSVGVGAGSGVGVQADDGDAVQGAVRVAVPAAVESVAGVCPDEAGIGEAPQSAANAASLVMRCGLSPAAISRSAAERRRCLWLAGARG